MLVADILQAAGRSEHFCKGEVGETQACCFFTDLFYFLNPPNPADCSQKPVGDVRTTRAHSVRAAFVRSVRNQYSQVTND